MNRDDKIQCSQGHIIKASELTTRWDRMTLADYAKVPCPICRQMTEWKLYDIKSRRRRRAMRS